MINDTSKLDARRNSILELLNQTGKVRVQTLSQKLGASEVTIRNDLSVLEKNGLLERVPGGAVQTMKNYYNMDLQQRRNENAAAKQSIAQVAASLVNDGDTLFLNSGTTTYFTALDLKRFKNLKIVTNSISIAMEMANVPTHHVMLLGGMINPQYSFTYGVNVLNELKHFKADKAILSVDGICNIGITTYHAEEADVSKMMLERARTSIIVADRTKIGRESFLLISELMADQYLVTNRCENSELFDELREFGITILMD
ncbi:DeoR/GlpR family DNA-binding transcription regulator [Christensenellaceae bacterium OttesenSCG-928-M15]|nr:DeoR/GlpR family DNA-binding transcription regulator [Christensenellaceae bacterium OttesenSCG-928-M15]